MALILVIDDDGSYLDVLRNVLSDEGHEVMLAQQRFRATHLAELARALEAQELLPTEDAHRRFGSSVAVSLTTANTICPGFR